MYCNENISTKDITDSSATWHSIEHFRHSTAAHFSAICVGPGVTSVADKRSGGTGFWVIFRVDPAGYLSNRFARSESAEDTGTDPRKLCARLTMTVHIVCLPPHLPCGPLGSLCHAYRRTPLVPFLSRNVCSELRRDSP